MPDLNKKEILTIIDDECTKCFKDEMNKFVGDNLDKEMAKKIHDKNSKSRAEIVSLVKDALESVFKLLWMKKDFWKTDIK